MDTLSVKIGIPFLQEGFDVAAVVCEESIQLVVECAYVGTLGFHVFYFAQSELCEESFGQVEQGNLQIFLSVAGKLVHQFFAVQIGKGILKQGCTGDVIVGVHQVMKGGDECLYCLRSIESESLIRNHLVVRMVHEVFCDVLDGLVVAHQNGDFVGWHTACHQFVHRL